MSSFPFPDILVHLSLRLFPNGCIWGHLSASFIQQIFSFPSLRTLRGTWRGKHFLNISTHPQTHTHTHTRKKLMSHCSLNTSVFLIMINHLFELSFSTRMNSSVINSMDFRARHLHYFPTRRSWANYWTKSLLQKGDVNTNYPQRVVLRMKWSYACISSIGGCTQ